MKSLKRLSLVIVALLIVVLSSKTSVSAETQYSENVIPKMTSDTSPSGRASSSRVYTENDYNYSPFKAFDYDISTEYNGWLTSNGQIEGWLAYEFQEPKSITKYTIVNRSADKSKSNVITQLPKEWTFEAYDEVKDKWIVLDIRSNVINWSYNEKKEFTFSNGKLYKKYRINITENCGGPLTSIGEMEMMESINIVPDKKLKVVLEVKEQLQLSVDEELDENLEMIWTSSDDTVATVDANGVVTALAPGNTMIAVTSADGTYTDYINVLVVDDAKDYRLAVDLKVGKSCRLTVDDLTDTVKVNWSSLDPTVATVSSKGKVTATGEGLTVVIATDEEGNEIGQIYIRVRE